MKDVIIIGSGPAGISAALYTVRAGLDTLVISRGSGALSKAELIENYYGFAEPISGVELEARGRRQAERLGVGFIEDEIVGLDWLDNFTLTGVNGEYTAKAVALTTGSARRQPNIPGFARFDGHGISWCATCDGFMCRGREVAVLGAGDYAAHEARELLPLASKVTLLTNGEPTPLGLDPAIFTDTRKISSLEGGALLERVVFEDGGELPVFRLFTAVGVAGSGELARKVGAVCEGGNIAVNADMATNVPGLYAAGDCTGGLLQVAKAVYQGAQAGIAMIKFIRNTKGV